MPTSILNIGIDRNYLTRRHHILAEAGFDVIDATSAQDALSSLDGRPVRAAIFGHRLPLAERLAICAELKKRLPALRVVVMYDHSANKTEHADAVLQINVPADDLVHTLQYLLSPDTRAKGLGLPS